MKRNVCLSIIVFGVFIFLMSQAVSSEASTLQIIQPTEHQTFYTSNIEVKVWFNFDDPDIDRKTFRLILNGKTVGFCLHYNEENVASGVITAADGLKASEHGFRVNELRAEVDGEKGKKYHKTVQFFVDCTGNQTPIANVGINQEAFVNEIVELDGSASSDGDNDPLAYRWSIIKAPKKSKAEFIDPSLANPTFVPDLPGTYVAQLIVDDYKSKSVPKKVTITVDQLKVLIDRPIDSPIFDILKNHGIVVNFDGSQLLENFHLVALDGSKYTKEEIFSNRLLRQAIKDGKWGIVFNVKQDQKVDALIKHLGIVNTGNATAYLFRKYIDGNTPVFRIFEIPYNIENGIDPHMFLINANRLLKTLRETKKSLVVNATVGDSNPIPDGLINCRWDYTTFMNWKQVWSGRHKESEGREQYGTHIINYTFTLFLDNGGNPTGNQQYLLLEIGGEANPNTTSSSFISTTNDMDQNMEFAWFQYKMTVGVYPEDSFWIWQANDPTSPNPVTTYTANSQFSIGFNQAQGILGSFTHTNTTSYTLTDWGISCNSSGKDMFWDAHSQNPDANQAFDKSEWFYTWCEKPLRPNDHSLQQAQYHASAVWRTGNIKDQYAVINAESNQYLGDTYCYGSNWGTTCCGQYGTSYKDSRVATPQFTLNLGAVIPIEVSAITFSQYPALVGPLGGTIKANIVLKEPAEMDIIFGNIVSTDTTHAVPKVDRTVIKKGAQSASLEIDVNAQGIADNGLFFASLTGFYAKDYSQQFTMKAVDTVYFPASAPWYDPDWETWGGTTSTSATNWKPGYQVRYAVSYVDTHNVESPKGPWSDWIGPGDVDPSFFPDAMPRLINIPTDPSGKARSRKLYRQFFANYQNANPDAGVYLITTLNDNTTTTYLDNNP